MSAGLDNPESQRASGARFVVAKTNGLGVASDRDYRKKGKSGSIPSDHAPVLALLD